MRRASWMMLVVATLSVAARAAEPTPANDSAALIDDATVALNLRYRYEFVDDNAFAEDADASTLRSRLTLQSGAWRNFAFLAEFDDVREIGYDDFNAGEGNTPARTRYPVVADPEGTEVNQAYVDYKGIARTTLRLGRQRINFDNQRFVGGVAWRQNEQTFDAVSLLHNFGRVHLFYAWVDGVHRIFGEEVPAGDQVQNNTHLMNVRADVSGVGMLTGYYYYIDNEEAPVFSTASVGVRLTGVRDLSGADIRYTAEFAHQEDAGGNPVSFDASYSLLEAGVIIEALDIGAGWEVLGGDEDTAGKAFRTPLATLHAFNGWVDKFLTTPPEGLDDKFVKAKLTLGNLLIEARYHRFEGEDSGADLGDEWNLQVGNQFHKRFRADLVYGDFDGDDPRAAYEDTRKAWVMLTASLP